MGRNSTNEDECCGQENTFTVINAAYIGNPSGPFQVFDDILPLSDNTYTIGSAALRWKEVHTLQIWTPRLASLTNDLTLNAATGFNVVTQKSMVPDQDAVHYCGFSTKRWQTVHAVNALFDTVSSQVGVPLTLAPAAGQDILLTATLRPLTDLTVDLGSALLRYTNVYGQTVNATTVATTTVNTTNITATTLTMNNTITTPTGIDLNLTAATGRNVVCSQTCRPDTDNSRNSGSSSQRWSNLHAVTTNTNTVSSYSARDLNLNAPAGQVILVNRTLTPNVDATLALGTNTNQWSDIRAVQSTFTTMNATTLIMNNTITTPSGVSLLLEATLGQAVVLSPLVVPIVDDAIALGTPAFRWNTLYTLTTNTNTISSYDFSNLELIAPTSGNVISAKSDVYPFDDAVQTLGASGNRWLNTHTQTTTTETVVAPAATDLTLDAPTGQFVRAKKSFLPYTTLTLDLGDATTSWRKVHTETVEGPIGKNLTLNPLASFAVVSTKNILPVITENQNLGSSVLKWNRVFANIVHQNNDNLSTTFYNTPSTLTASSFTNIALASISNASWDAGSSTFKFPVPGWYQIQFMSLGDTTTGPLSTNAIVYRLREEAGFTTLGQAHVVGSVSDANLPQWQFIQTFFVASTVERWNIQVFRNTYNVTNWVIQEGILLRLAAT